MCNFASAILTRDKVFFGTTDSHEEVIARHHLHEGAAALAGNPNFVRAELTPPIGRVDAPIAKWIYWLDQPDRPEWYEEKQEAARLRRAVEESGLATLYADYNTKLATLYADYNTKWATLHADYNTKRATLYANYNTKWATLHADYNTKRATLYADYNTKWATLYADYKAKRATIAAQAW